MVAQEFNDGKEMEEDLFAATPPLEAMRMLMSDVATKGGGGKRKVLMLADVKKAFYEAAMRRDVCMEIPEEDKEEEDRKEDKVAYLKLAMPGTRDAANAWQEEVARWMRGLGFTRGRYSPCIYWNRKKGIKATVHGDDFIISCGVEEVSWMRGKMEERFTAKVVVIGHGKDEEKEGKVLNRIVRAIPTGWEYEADPRHAEIIVKEMGVQDCKAVGSPGEDEKKYEIEENDTELEKGKATKYRKIAARANYLASDRIDIQYSVKEVCRLMAKPTEGGWKKLKRLARYLKGRPRVVWQYRWQGERDHVEVYTDSDWAGCARTRRSTSGGIAMRGKHIIKGWSVTQKTVAVSSGEAEMVAVVKGVQEGIGIKAALADWGEEVKVRGMCDSTAAIGIVNRRGVGKIRHLDVGKLWVQELREEGSLEVKKVLGTENPADQLTKYLGPAEVDKGMAMAGVEVREGRSEVAVGMERGIRN